MDTILTVKAEDLARLSPQEAVNFFREMLWAEATALGIGINLINVPGAITVGDGGIDAEVRDVPINGGQGIVKQGLTRYQIKTGEFVLSEDHHIKEILFRVSALKKGRLELKPKIQSCLDEDGTLVVVLFGWDNPDPKEQFREKFVAELIAIDPKYRSAKIEVFQQNQLIGFLKPFISLALKANGNDDKIFQTHYAWSEQAEMQRPFKMGDAQKKFLSDLQTQLRRDSETIHLYVRGEAGIGKTRLVLEATRTDDLSPLVIYCDSPEHFKYSNLMNELLKADNQFSCILVIDECDFENRTYIWDKLRNRGRRIKLITIYNEFDPTSGSTLPIDVQPLDNAQISDMASHGEDSKRLSKHLKTEKFSKVPICFTSHPNSCISSYGLSGGIPMVKGLPLMSSFKIYPILLMIYVNGSMRCLSMQRSPV